VQNTKQPKATAHLLPSFMHILSTMLPNLSIPDVPFPAHLSALIRRRFQVKPATLLIPIGLFLFPLVKDFYGTRHRSGSFSLINVGSDFHCLHSFLLMLDMFIFTRALVTYARTAFRSRFCLHFQSMCTHAAPRLTLRIACFDRPR